MGVASLAKVLAVRVGEPAPAAVLEEDAPAAVAELHQDRALSVEVDPVPGLGDRPGAGQAAGGGEVDGLGEGALQERVVRRADLPDGGVDVARSRTPPVIGTAVLQAVSAYWSR